MRKIVIIYVAFSLTMAFNAFCQSDSSIAYLEDIHLITDGYSRYGIPKISPSGDRVLTTRNRDTLIYIDLKSNREVVLLTGASYPRYYWIDNTQVFYDERYYPKKTINQGILSINSFQERILYTNVIKDYSIPEKRKTIPIIYTGKYIITYDLEKKRVYREIKGSLIELTKDTGMYFEFVLSHNEERIIIHSTNGGAYNYDFEGNDSPWHIVNGIVTSWSPDDNYLLYYVGRGEEPNYTSELYICSSDGVIHQQLTDTKHLREMRPSWSDNSNKIVFFDDISNQLYVSTIIVE